MIKWGSSATDYWYGTGTTQYNGQALQVGWNLIGVDWDSASETGTPDSSAVDYVSVRITYGAAQTDAQNFRIGSFSVRTAAPTNITYYSVNMATDSSGTGQEEFAADTDYAAFSGKHDWMRNIVVYGALAIIFGQMNQNTGEDQKWERKYETALRRAMLRMPRRRRWQEQTLLAPDVNINRYN